jgi:hypothetical protein
MLDRASGELDAKGEGTPAAPPAITVEQFPGICMGASMLVSLSLNKIGFDALSEDEGKALTSALLKNAEAWQLAGIIGNPKVAAALDLLGVGVAILTPRIIADAAQRRPKSPTQEAAQAAADAPIAAAA